MLPGFARFSVSAGLAAAAFAGFADAGLPVRALPDRQQLARHGLTLAWHHQISILGRERVGQMAVHESTIIRRAQDDENALDGGKEDPAKFKRERDAVVFVGTTHGVGHCFEADTGVLRWQQSVGQEGDQLYMPAVTDRYIYVAAGMKLLRLERQSGRIVHTRNLPAYASAGPAANDNYCFVPVGDSLVCYDLPDPRLEGKGPGRATERFVPDVVNGGKMFTIKLPPGQTRSMEAMPERWRSAEAMSAAPFLFQNQVIGVAANGRVISYSQENGSRKFIRDNRELVTAPLAVLERFLFVASADTGLYCVNVRDGRQIWRFGAGSAVRQRPIPMADDVFVMPGNGGLVAIDLREGKETWRNEDAKQLVAVSKKNVYATNERGELLILNRKDGGKLGAMSLGQFTVSTPNNQFNDRLYLASPDGLVICLHEADSPKPYLHPQATGIEEAQPEQKGLAKETAGKQKKDAEDADKPKPKPQSKPKAPSKKKPKDGDAGDDNPKGAKGNKGGGRGGEKKPKGGKKKGDDGDL